MLHKNSLAFASQADDCLAESEIIKKFQIKKALLWLSGGCMALNLKSQFDEMEITVFDESLEQLEHFKAKINAIKRKDFDHLNLDNADQLGLNQSGKYESLLRIFRRFFYEFVVDHDNFEALFLNGNSKQRKKYFNEIKSSTAWNHSFEMFFSQKTLSVVLGGQWSVDSCQRVKANLEKLLLDENANENWLLKQAIFGHYDQESNPPYFSIDKIKDGSFCILNSSFLNIKNIADFQLVDLSNYLDFRSETDRHKILKYCANNMQSGSVLMLRSMKDKTDLWDNLAPEFQLDRNWGDELLNRDKSFLNSHLLIAIKE